MFSNHSHKVDFQLSNHLNHSRNTGLIVYFNFETNMQADLSVHTRPSLTRNQHYALQLNCHTQIYFLHRLTSSNGLFRKQPVFLVPAADSPFILFMHSMPHSCFYRLSKTVTHLWLQGDRWKEVSSSGTGFQSALKLLWVTQVQMYHSTILSLGHGINI